MGAEEKKEKKELYNPNLISLKCVLFLFFGGLGCLFPFLPLHMVAIGLNYEESRIISIVAPLVSIIGPLVVGPLADKLAGKKGSTGKYLRVIGAICMLLSVVMYLLLLAVPTLSRSETHEPKVSFACDSDGGIIFQERCTEEKSCYHWKKEKMGSLILTNCSYTCQKPSQFESLYNPWISGSPVPPKEVTSSEFDDYSDGNYNDANSAEKERTRRAAGSNLDSDDKIYVEPPHLCQTTEDDLENNKPSKCHVYTSDTKSLKVQAILRSATNQENDTHSAEWCRYPLDGFQCNVPPVQAAWMISHTNSSNCKPMVECEVVEPYSNSESVLAESGCIKVDGDADTTFWWYLIIRSLADIFPTAAIVLLDTSIIIATRETSSGRGDVGHQLAWGSLGWAIFAPISGVISVAVDTPAFLVPFIIFAILTVIAAIALLLAKAMPLSPPEWWWHTKSGMLAIPMSAIRKYGPETAGLVFVSLLLGIFWSAIDSYQGWHLYEISEKNNYYELTGKENIYAESGRSDMYDDMTPLVGLTLTVGALTAIPLLWYAENIVDYCGHSNILISSFAVYVIRYTFMAQIGTPGLVLILEALEPITLGLTWVTIILYMRHIIPRRITATGQALPVIAHFCTGKAIGAAIGFIKTGSPVESFRSIYMIMAIAGVVIAVGYFFLYHCILAPRCGAKPQQPNLTSETGAGNGNGGNLNGNYSPLRVYHNARGRMGHFRY